MSDPAPDPTDGLDDLLTPAATGPSQEMRAALLRRTERVLARGRLARRAARGAAVAAVFAAGGLAGWVVKPDRTRVELVRGPAEVVAVPIVVPVPGGPPAQAPGPPETVPSVEPVSAADAELRAEQTDDPAAAARLYQLAGDMYLAGAQDYRNAARCYRLYLDRAGGAGLSPEPGDSWLLISLKNAVFQEKRDVAKTDG